MKKSAGIITLIAAILMASGCATSFPKGSLYTEVKLPVAVTSEGGKNLKVGTAECTDVLGLIATGDASIDTAKKNGGITRVSHVDWQAKNILGIIGTYKVTVYGY